MCAKQKSQPPADTRNLLLVGKTWYLRALVNGATIKQSLRTSSLPLAQSRRDDILRNLRAPKDERSLLKQVQRQLVGIAAEEEDAANRRDKGILLADAFERWERDPARRPCGQRQVDDHRSNWRRFLEWMHRRHPEVKYCRQMTRTIGREWAADMYAVARTTNTYNKWLTTVRYVFAVISEYDERIVNPMAGVRAKKEVDGVSKEPFTEDELRRIFASGDAAFRRLCAIGLYTTLRLSDAAALQWEAFSPRLEYLHARHGKTGSDASMRVPGPLREVLAETPAAERAGPVFPEYDGRGRCWLNQYVLRELEVAGIQTRREVEGLNGQRRVACVKGFHSFRHTAITMALAAGKTSAQVRRLAGHATEAMQRRYTHLDADDAGDAAEAIGKFW